MGKLKRLLLCVAAILAILILFRASSRVEDSLTHQPLDWKQVEKEKVENDLFAVNVEVKDFYSLSALSHKGKPVDFHAFEGKVVLIVNIAVHDQKTSLANFGELQDLYHAYHDKGLEILAFPSKQLSHEEMNSAEVQQIAAEEFQVKFPLMDDIIVNGEDQHPVYAFLKRRFPGTIRANFGAKFLVNRRGEVVKRSRFTPKQLEPEIQALLMKL
eukprot:m.69167 g.69167  ORF g.69167 m.69167 type:complete len:214 (-) comp12818_c0_seq1:19-660(-)